EKRMLAGTARVPHIVIAIHEINRRIGIQTLRDFVEGIRCQDVVVVQQSDELTAGQLESMVGRTPDALVLCQEFQLHASLFGSPSLQKGTNVPGGRAIVDDTKLPMRIQLLAN